MEGIAHFSYTQYPNNKWVSFPELDEAKFTGTDSLYVRNILPLYFQSLRSGANRDYTQASLLESLHGFQKRFGTSVLPKAEKIEAEIQYSKYDIFKITFSWYLYAGTLLFCGITISNFKERE